MSLLEKASMEQWKLNLLLLTVPDEEVNSVGMREAVPKLLQLAEEHKLNYSFESYIEFEPLISKAVENTETIAITPKAAEQDEFGDLF